VANKNVSEADTLQKISNINKGYTSREENLASLPSGPLSGIPPPETPSLGSSSSGPSLSGPSPTRTLPSIPPPSGVRQPETLSSGHPSPVPFSSGFPRPVPPVPRILPLEHLPPGISTKEEVSSLDGLNVITSTGDGLGVMTSTGGDLGVMTCTGDGMTVIKSHLI